MESVKVVVEVQGREQAIWMLQGVKYLQLLEDFYDWMQGVGREENMVTAAKRLQELAAIHGVSIH